MSGYGVGQAGPDEGRYTLKGVDEQIALAQAALLRDSEAGQPFAIRHLLNAVAKMSDYIKQRERSGVWPTA
jgi:hypothetical protein